MKSKISVTVDHEIIDLIENATKSGKFRNRSHLIEYSIRKFISENREKDKDKEEGGGKEK